MQCLKIESSECNFYEWLNENEREREREKTSFHAWEFPFYFIFSFEIITLFCIGIRIPSRHFKVFEWCSPSNSGLWVYLIFALFYQKKYLLRILSVISVYVLSFYVLCPLRSYIRRHQRECVCLFIRLVWINWIKWQITITMAIEPIQCLCHAILSEPRPEFKFMKTQVNCVSVCLYTLTRVHIARLCVCSRE